MIMGVICVASYIGKEFSSVERMRFVMWSSQVNMKISPEDELDEYSLLFIISKTDGG